MFDYIFYWCLVFNVLLEMFVGSLVMFQVIVLLMFFGIFIVLFLVFVWFGGNCLLCVVVGVWIFIVWNILVLFQIYIFYFGLGFFGLYVSFWFVLFVGVIFNNVGYFVEIFCGGFQVVFEIQLWVVCLLGMSVLQVYCLVVILQLLWVVFYLLINQLVWVMLMIFFGVVVGLIDDFIGVIQVFNVKIFCIFEYFVLVVVFYFVMVKLLVLVVCLLGWCLFCY